MKNCKINFLIHAEMNTDTNTESSLDKTKGIDSEYNYITKPHT